MPRAALLVIAVVALAAPDVASADFIHVVAPGESLTSIAAQDGLSVDQLAAANGLSPYAELIAGANLAIPPRTASQAQADGSPAGPVTDSDGDFDGDDTAGSAQSSAGPGGSYVVQPGDTLTAIAARAGESVDQLAAANGLDPNGVLLAGSIVKVSGGPATVETSYSTGSSSSNPASSQLVGSAAQGSVTAPPYPTAERLTASEIGQIASSEGVPPALAEAIAWQESGFNNDLVSTSDARGVMQILPGTWSWIGQNLATPPPLGPASAAQNVRAGTLLLHALLLATGGNQQLAAAGYFQGLASVQQNGIYPATQQYVNDVMSLEHQFGGG
jgi:N-acetylmuramoyl-L-alanine amidase